MIRTSFTSDVLLKSENNKQKLIDTGMRSAQEKFRGEVLFNRVTGMLRRRLKPVFFFDFDGTLTDIVLRPEDVHLKNIARDVLAELSQEFSVGVISGRRLSDVRRYVMLKGIYYSGNHGIEIQGPSVDFIEPQSAKSEPYIGALAGRLRKLSADYGARVNSKGYSVSVHYRTVSTGRVKGLLERIDAALADPVKEGKVKVFHGKKVVEVKPPVDWDKGRAIELICRKIGAATMPIFFGDDTTDEYGFRRVNTMGGVSVFVGKSGWKTAAKFRVESPSELIGELAKFLFRQGE